MNLEELKLKTRELINDYPEYREEFVDFYELAESEIEEGGSEQHECELAYGDMMHIVHDLKMRENPVFDLSDDELSWKQEQIQKEINKKSN
jgi:hypothetical protein